MRIPAGFAFAVIPAHRFVAWEKVLDCASQTVAGMRFAIGRWRAFEEDIFFAVFSLGQGAIVNFILAPKFKNLFFLIWEADILDNGLKSTRIL